MSRLLCIRKSCLICVRQPKVIRMRKVVRTPDFPVVKTKKGRLHGFLDDDVYTFRGIRYGRAQRFALPEETESWKGVKNAKSYGYVCPLMPAAREALFSLAHDPGLENNPMAEPFSSFEMAHVYWPMDEDCLFLNVWTKHLPGAEESSVSDAGRRDKDIRNPVLVWLHGGGFGAGSSIEIPSYEGRNLASHGDVVVVSINHRLNCLGFLDLSAFGDEFRFSGIAGMADIVLALKWVRENIAAFGGDPDNVTVAGQSGGGGKAMALLQMPCADGLYRRIISQSGAPGAFERIPGQTLAEEKEVWQRLGLKTAEILHLDQETIGRIRDISYEDLSAAAEEAGRALGYADGMMLFEPSPVPGFYEGRYEYAGFREETRAVSVMAGNVLGEFNFMHYLGDKDAYADEEKRAILKLRYAEKTEEVLRAFQKVYPGLDPLYALSVDAMFRPVTVKYLNARAAFTDAPCYNYLMSFIIPYLGGVAPWHCACIPYMFRNVDKEPALATGSTYAERLMEEVSGAWLAFMREGDPSTEDLPWPAYTAERHCRMEFSEQSRVTDADDSELLALVN